MRVLLIQKDRDFLGRHEFPDPGPTSSLRPAVLILTIDLNPLLYETRICLSSIDIARVELDSRL